MKSKLEDSKANQIRIPANRFSLSDIDEAKKFYDAHGYVIFKDFYSQEDILDFKNEVSNIIKAHLNKANLTIDTNSNDLLTSGIVELEKVDHEFVAAIYDTIFQSPSFFRIAGNKNTEKVIKYLLGLDQKLGSLYGYTNRCRIDPPRDNRRTYGWHQEVFYTVPEGNYIQTWAPLIFDTTVENGTIEVASGSHKEGIAKQSWNEIEGKATQIIVEQEIVDKYPKGPVEMKVGELLFFSGFLSHRSGNNTSNQVRYSLVGMYHDVNHKPFVTPKLSFNYRGQTPKDFYSKHFNK